MKMHPAHRPCRFALAASPARSRTIDLRGNVTHTGNLGSVPSRGLGGSVVRWLGSCANSQHETHASRPENEGLVPKAPILKYRIILRGQANIMQIACAVAGSVPKFSVEHRGWKVQEMGHRHRFTRSRFGFGVDGGGTLCVDLSTGEVTGTMSFNWYFYANFGWKWFNRTYDCGGSFESDEKLWGTFGSFKILPPIEESDDYNCCCEQKYGRRK